MDKQREKLIYILGMLGSAYDGEILNAAKKAEEFRKSAGLTWEQVIGDVKSTLNPNQAKLASLLRLLRGRDEELRKKNLQAAALQQKASILERKITELQTQIRNQNSPNKQFSNPAEKVKTRPTIADMLEFLLNRNIPLNSGTIKFLESLESWYSDSGFLTEKQFSALYKIYEESLSDAYA